jgi:hypothetical protein
MNDISQYHTTLMGPKIYCDFCKITHGKIHCDFEVTTMGLTEGDCIVINDLNKGNRSVTNDIEYVVWWLHNKAGLSKAVDKYKIIYKDSIEFYDRITIKDNHFLGWYPIQEKDVNKAVKK